MKCVVPCSFGELIDKITILKIKEEYAKKGTKCLINIQNELRAIESHNKVQNDPLFKTLHLINKKLWKLEDLIREKSKKREFDEEYIKCSEMIHKTNDERYKTKFLINEKYDSEIREEKLYACQEVSLPDLYILEKAKNYYTQGEYDKSHAIITVMIEKYKNYCKYDEFYIDLLFSYSNVCKIYQKKNQYKNKIREIMQQLPTLDIRESQKTFCKTIYGMQCLNDCNYIEAYDYLHTFNSVEQGNITSNNMSFFSKNDVNMRLLVYDSGGIGDKFMLSRFVVEVCRKYSKNYVIFLVESSYIWIFENAFADIPNLKLVTTNDKFVSFNYHCSLMCLIKYLNHSYHTLNFQPLFKNITIKSSNIASVIISKIKQQDKPVYVLNWKGNPNNLQERNNRSIDLKIASKLFQIDSVKWIVLTKEITNEEQDILDNHNIDCYGRQIDNNNAFADTFAILKHVKCLVSTDTSFLHLSENMDLSTIALLTLGCEWRWTHDETTNWYPKMKLMRQKEYGNWRPLINELILYIINMENSHRSTN